MPPKAVVNVLEPKEYAADPPKVMEGVMHCMRETVNDLSSACEYSICVVDDSSVISTSAEN